MNKKLSNYYKVLIILCFISIGIFNFFYSYTPIGTLECKHDFLKGIIELIAKCLEYIGILGGIIFVIISKYKDKKYDKGIEIILIIAFVIPFLLSTIAYCIKTYDSNHDYCKIKEYEWVTISTNDS